VSDRTLAYGAAFTEAIALAMEADPDVFVAGEDVGLAGGVFGTFRGLYDRFGGDRVVDTPISEQAIIGLGVGAAVTGLRPIVDLMFMDFMFVAMDQIVNQAAKLKYMFGGTARLPLTITVAGGGGLSAAAQHSQSLEAMLAHVPGLRIAIPATAADAYAMNRAAVALDDPVLVFESRRLYPMKGPVRRGAVDASVGRAEIVRPGDDVTVVTWGTARAWCEQALAELSAAGVHAELIDLRWISPWDQDAVIDSVHRTGRLVVVHEAVVVAGFGAEVVSTVAQALGPQLRACARVGSTAAPIPASPVLSAQVLPSVARIIAAVEAVLGQRS